MVQTRSQRKKRRAVCFVDEECDVSQEEYDVEESDCDDAEDPTLGGFIVEDGVEDEENAPHPRLARFGDEDSEEGSGDDDVPLSVLKQRLDESQEERLEESQGVERRNGSGTRSSPKAEEPEIRTLPISFNAGRTGGDVTREEFIKAGVFLEQQQCRYSIGLERGDTEYNLHIQGVALAKVRASHLVSEFTGFLGVRGDLFFIGHASS